MFKEKIQARISWLPWIGKNRLTQQAWSKVCRQMARLQIPALLPAPQAVASSVPHLSHLCMGRIIGDNEMRINWNTKQKSMQIGLAWFWTLHVSHYLRYKWKCEQSQLFACLRWNSTREPFLIWFRIFFHASTDCSERCWGIWEVAVWKGLFLNQWLRALLLPPRTLDQCQLCACSITHTVSLHSSWPYLSRSPVGDQQLWNYGDGTVNHGHFLTWPDKAAGRGLTTMTAQSWNAKFKRINFLSFSYCHYDFSFFPHDSSEGIGDWS